MTSQKGRIDFIHLLRGIAPLIVLWAHIPAWWLAANDRSWPPFDAVQVAVMQPLNLYQNGGQLGVVVFFLISGFIMSHIGQFEGRAEFLTKRFFRIWPLLLLSLIVMAMAQTASLSIAGTTVTGHAQVGVQTYLQNAVLLNWALPGPIYALSVTWTLFPEIIFYVMVLIMLPYLGMRPVLTTAALLVASMGLNLGAWAVGGHYLTSVLLCLPMFALGRSFYLLWSGRTSLPVAIALAAASCVGFTILQLVLHPDSARALASTYPLAVLLFLAAMLLPFKLASALRFFGDISYALYLFHMPIGMLTVNVLAAHDVTLWFVFPLAWLASIVVAWSVTRWIGDPIYRWGVSGFRDWTAYRRSRWA